MSALDYQHSRRREGLQSQRLQEAVQQDAQERKRQDQIRQRTHDFINESTEYGEPGQPFANAPGLGIPRDQARIAHLLTEEDVGKGLTYTEGLTKARGGALAPQPPPLEKIPTAPAPGVRISGKTAEGYDFASERPKPERDRQPAAVHGYGITKFVDPETGRVVSETRVPTAPRNIGGSVSGGSGAFSRDDAEEIASAIERGEQPPNIRGLYRNAAPVRASLARKGYNLARAELDWNATQKHLSTLNGPQQERLRQAIQFTADSTDVIENLYKEWQQLGPKSGFRVLNRAALAAAKQVPGRTGAVAQGLEAQINDLTSELATVYKGGNTSTDESLRLAAENLKADWNQETFKKALGLIRTNLKIRKNSILSSEAVGVTAGSPYLPGQPTPEAPPPPSIGPQRSRPPLSSFERQ